MVGYAVANPPYALNTIALLKMLAWLLGNEATKMANCLKNTREDLKTL